jgi:uncharacterized phiE125 gp8 family phage protein
MPIAANALTTLEAVKSYLKIDVSQTVDDTRLEDLINACSSAIENYCGRKFKEQTISDEDYNGTGTKYILLKQFPVKNISSVSIDGTVLAADQYKIKKSDGLLIRNNSVWPVGDINISVTYTAGFSEIPPDLELACRHFVMSFFKADVAAFSTTFSDGLVFRADAMPAQVKMILQPYKKVI